MCSTILSDPCYPWLIIGLDIEWKPVFRKGILAIFALFTGAILDISSGDSSNTAVIQFYDGARVYVFHVVHYKTIPNTLKQV